MATGINDISGGRSPASIRATRHEGSSESREAITAPAEPPPTTMKSNVSGMLCLYVSINEGFLGLPLKMVAILPVLSRRKASEEAPRLKLFALHGGWNCRA